MSWKAREEQILKWKDQSAVSSPAGKLRAEKRPPTLIISRSLITLAKAVSIEWWRWKLY